jgi:hypothetical protein
MKLYECQFKSGEVGVTTDTFLSTDRLSACNVISDVRDLNQSRGGCFMYVTYGPRDKARHSSYACAEGMWRI